MVKSPKSSGARRRARVTERRNPMSSPASDDDAFQPMPERTLFTSGKVVAIYRVGFFTTILRRNQLNFPGCQRLLRGAKLCLMITPEEIVGEEWASWYRLSPQE